MVFVVASATKVALIFEPEPMSTRKSLPIDSDRRRTQMIVSVGMIVAGLVIFALGFGNYAHPFSVGPVVEIYRTSGGSDGSRTVAGGEQLDEQRGGGIIGMILGGCLAVLGAAIVWETVRLSNHI